MMEVQEEIRQKISVSSAEEFVRDEDDRENIDLNQMQLNTLEIK